jgi:hypothetical protein
MPTPLCLAIAILLSAAPARAQRVEVIEATQPASGRSVSFDLPVVGPQGQIAWGVRVGEDDGMTLRERRDGETRNVAVYGNQAFGRPAGSIYGLTAILGYDAPGRLYFVSFSARLGATSAPFGIWRTAGRGDLELLAHSGQILPGGSEPMGEELAHAEIGGSGHLAVSDKTGRILLRGPEGGFEVAVSSDTPPSGMPPGARFSAIGGFSVDPRGDLVFDAQVAVGDGRGGLGVWRRLASGDVSLLARTGAEVFGRSGSRIDWIAEHHASSNGSVALVAYVRQPDGTKGTSCLLFTDGTGPATPVLCSGDPAPGFLGKTFGTPTDTSIADDGSLWFTSVVAAPSAAPGRGNRSIWRKTASGLRAVAYDGMPLPELAGVTLGNPWALRPGPKGDLVFGARMAREGTTVTVPGWFAIPSGSEDPVLLAADGQEVEIRPDERQLAMFEASSFGSGFAAFRVIAQDETYAIGRVSLPAPVPVPAPPPVRAPPSP